MGKKEKGLVAESSRLKLFRGGMEKKRGGLNCRSQHDTTDKSEKRAVFRKKGNGEVKKALNPETRGNSQSP